MLGCVARLGCLPIPCMFALHIFFLLFPSVCAPISFFFFSTVYSFLSICVCLSVFFFCVCLSFPFPPLCLSVYLFHWFCLIVDLVSLVNISYSTILYFSPFLFFFFYIFFYCIQRSFLTAAILWSQNKETNGQENAAPSQLPHHSHQA